MNTEDVTAETFQLDLPPDLLAELERRNAKRTTDFRVEGMKPSLLERLAAMLGLG